jgi:DNA-binding NarL/FixJ family response regulator
VSIRVAIADDQALVRSGFRLILEARTDLEVVGEGEDGVEAVALVQELAPDVILLDIRMPNLDGIEATKRIVASGSRTRILVLTTFDRNEWVYEALRAGASGFLLKDVRASQLTDAIRTVAAGESLLAPSITTRLIEEFVKTRTPVTPARPPTELTAREVDVLRLVAGGLSNAEIAQRLVIGQSTVKTHVNRLLTKLDLRDRTQAVVYAYENRLIQPQGRPATSDG